VAFLLVRKRRLDGDGIHRLRDAADRARPSAASVAAAIADSVTNAERYAGAVANG
jgi:hypothetical protein